MNMTSLELRELQQSGADFLLVDVREAFELTAGKIPGSIHVPLRLLSTDFPEFDKNKLIIMYCHAGVRSQTARDFLKDQGYTQVFSLHGGILSYPKEFLEL